MGAITLVLGGARSGKTRHALALCDARVAAEGLSPVYVATAEALDDEMRDRIARHRAERGPQWRTVEAPRDLAGAIRREASPETILLVDCLTLWLSNLLAGGPDAGAPDLDAATTELVAALGEAAGPVVLVSNEVGLGIVPENALARAFRDEAGRVNQAVAAAADRVDFVAAGLTLPLKGAGATHNNG